MGDTDNNLAGFMMSKAENNSTDTGIFDLSNENNVNDIKDGDDGNKKEKKKELTEEEKALQDAKKEAKAIESKIPFNPELIKRQAGKLIFVYALVGGLILGLWLMHRKNNGWFSKGMSSGFQYIMFGGRR